MSGSWALKDDIGDLLSSAPQDALMAFMGGGLELHKHRHPEGSRERALYEASIGLTSQGRAKVETDAWVKQADATKEAC